MKLTDFYLAQLEHEAEITRRTLRRVPQGRNDWKPHEKSMEFGYLAALCAGMLLWTVFMVNQEDLDLATQGAEFTPKVQSSADDLVKLLDESVAAARKALSSTNDEHLMKPWRFMMAGKVVSEQPRYVAIRDAIFSHLAHHRGQLSVYLRLNEALVPAMYGPSADERF